MMGQQASNVVRLIGDAAKTMQCLAKMAEPQGNGQGIESIDCIRYCFVLKISDD